MKGNQKEVKALNNYVFFKIEIKQITGSGIIIPTDGSKSKNMLAKHTMRVVNVGKDVKNVNAGDVIVVWSNTWMKISNEVYKELTDKDLKESEVCGIVKEEHITAVIN